MPIKKNTSINSHCSVFLETGTFHGKGVAQALKAGYSKVISIEIFEPLYKGNLLRFSKEIEEGRVQLVLGDSGYVIGKTIEPIDEPILFWFDAHDQTMSGAGVGDVKCPIIKELTNIMTFRNLDQRALDTLVIYDMRKITKKNRGWDVDLNEMYETIWKYNPNFSLTREDGYIAHDILRCEYKFIK